MSQCHFAYGNFICFFAAQMYFHYNYNRVCNRNKWKGEYRFLWHFCTRISLLIFLTSIMGIAKKTLLTGTVLMAAPSEAKVGDKTQKVANPVWISDLVIIRWRRERDSNPRYLSVRRFSRPMQSTTLPSLLCMRRSLLSKASAKLVFFFHSPKFSS